MTPEAKSQWKSLAKTGGVIGAAAAVVLGITSLVLPDLPEPALPVVIGGPGTNYVAHGEYLTWRYPDKSQLKFNGFVIMQTTNFKNWQIAGYALGTNIWFVPSNRPAGAFYTIGEAYALYNKDVKIKRQGF